MNLCTNVIFYKTPLCQEDRGVTPMMNSEIKKKKNKKIVAPSGIVIYLPVPEVKIMPSFEWLKIKEGKTSGNPKKFQEFPKPFCLVS